MARRGGKRRGRRNEGGNLRKSETRCVLVNIEADERDDFLATELLSNSGMGGVVLEPFPAHSPDRIAFLCDGMIVGVASVVPYPMKKELNWWRSDAKAFTPPIPYAGQVHTSFRYINLTNILLNR